ncbi:MAG: phosphotransferase family protein [Chloroflexi bacterium]|nr:phosphotransferase family protein [Chloroflexota bacterium]
MTLTIEKAIARIPQWSNASDIKTSPLTGGITNENFRIEVNGDVFVLRIPGVDTELLGIVRPTECAVSQAAGEIGIGPEVFYIIEPEGYLVTRFIEGRQLLPDEIGQPQNINRVADAIRRVHNMAPILETFSPFRVVEDSTEIARRFKVLFPDNFGWLIEQMNAAETALLKSPFTPKICHNDLLNANFLDDGQIRILDWEYAGMGDPAFDLANFSTHHEFTNDQDRWLLECYFGEVTAENWARIKLLKVISDFREAMWAMVQIGISKLDFNFRNYADTFFARTTQGMQNAMWQQWLKDVSSDRKAYMP